MKGAVDHYLSVCAKRGDEPGRPFSGKLNLRLGTDLHRAAALAAADGESLNNWLVRVVESAAQQAPPRKPSSLPTRPAKRVRGKTNRERSK
jgi:predicted HicB family RNase H-like nuclease